MPNLDQTKKRRDFLAGATASVGLMALGLPNPLFAKINNLEPAPQGAKTSYLAIYPPIGICRVGSSPATTAFNGPEVPGFVKQPEGGYKDEQMRMKKQRQRFFIYAFDQDGRVIKEITANNARIEWTVHVANSKAAWYGFNNPFDLGADAPGIPAPRRNPGIANNQERERRLVIDAGAVRIGGKNTNASAQESAYEMAGTFWTNSTKVRLGCLQTDADGRLLVVPADGVSASVLPYNPIVDFTKNDAWYDDWCDGWVQARVHLPDLNEPLEAKPAWVASCGPDFAPDIPSFTTMYDTIEDAMVRKQEQQSQKDKSGKAQGGLSLRPKLPLSFTKDIYPLFYRLGLMQWVSNAALLQKAWMDAGNFADFDFIQQLASKDNHALRHKTFAAFRDPKSTTEQRYRLPYMLGGGVDYEGVSSHWFLMTDLQYWILQQWDAGNFVNDFQGVSAENSMQIFDLPLQNQPTALTKAALDALSGGNFHPGVELTWVLGRPELYEAHDPFRIALGHRPSLIQDLGPFITPEKTLPPPDFDMHQTLDHYPVGPQMPGDLTRWMGLPWQPDAFSCQAVNYPNDFPVVVWWPASIPVDVLPEFAYRQMLRLDLTREERMSFFYTRVAWSRGAAGIGYHANASYFDGLNRMIYLWERMGVVVKKETPVDLTTGPNALPREIFVETQRNSMEIDDPHDPRG